MTAATCWVFKVFIIYLIQKFIWWSFMSDIYVQHFLVMEKWKYSRALGLTQIIVLHDISFGVCSSNFSQKQTVHSKDLKNLKSWFTFFQGAKYVYRHNWLSNILHSSQNVDCACVYATVCITCHAPTSMI